MTSPHPTKRRCLSRSVRVSQACEACAVSKVKCDDSTVCRRCFKKNIECVRSHPRRPPSPSGPEPKTTPNRAYVRSLDLSPSVAVSGQASFDTKRSDTDVSDASWWEQISYLLAASEESTDELLNQPLDLPEAGSSNEATRDKIDSYHNTSWNCVKAADFANIGGDAPHSSVSAEAGNAVSDVKKTYKELFQLSPPEADQVLDSDESQLFILPEEELFANEAIALDNDTALMPLLDNHTRDQILLSTHLYPACRSRRPGPGKSFPSLGIMRKLLQTFFNLDKKHVAPFIHVPTFEPSTCDIKLVMACIAAGGASSTHSQLRSFSHALMELGCRQAAPLVRQTSFLTH